MRMKKQKDSFPIDPHPLVVPQSWARAVVVPKGSYTWARAEAVKPEPATGPDHLPYPLGLGCPRRWVSMSMKKKCKAIITHIFWYYVQPAILRCSNSIRMIG